MGGRSRLVSSRQLLCRLSRQALDQLAVGRVAGLVGASLSRLQDALQVVENEQTARAAQILQQEFQLLVQGGWQLGQAVARQHLQRGAQDLVQRRGIEQRAPDHDLEVRGHGPHDAGGQRGLAHAAHAQQSDQATAVVEEPLLHLRRFGLPAIERADVGDLAPGWSG